ncbi:PAS domain S-box [Methanomethylovorans hollandica DSM 15978]|uniref:histidine kinase n=1 Tax=Methanomethylovorans hollandica (strain DSM 15978 / NBRC 107637 / DMS1) TaxID=867904 RepID=L0KV61_METHD|nr:PAS domain S-box protein [Methanomethylovorans hollandica]AGB48590.1 PAS domain S-box [Methanomethylovorans hollandica DSM 15978]
MKKIALLQSFVDEIPNLFCRLEIHGYYVHTSFLLEENIIDEIKRNQYDAFLLDLSGTPIEELRKNHYLSEISGHIPVILIAPYVDYPLLESLGNVHISGCLIPPFSDEQLCSTIELACHNHNILKTNAYDMKNTLFEKERSYAMLLSNLPGMAYRCDNDQEWTMRFVSEGCYKLTGYDSEALLHNRDISYNRLITPENQAHIWKKYQEMLARKETFQDEYTITTAIGEVKWVWEQGKGVYADNGELIAIEGFIADITEKKKVQETLRESESRYRSLFENNHSAMLVIDPEIGSIIDANPAAVSLYGWTREELRSKTIKEINALSPFEVKEEMDRAVKGQRIRFFFKHSLADGSVRDVEVFSSPILMDRKMLLYSIINDITELNRMEQELLLNRFCIDHSVVGIFRIEEPDGRIVSVNDHACQSLGYSREELCSMTVLDIDPTFTPETWIEHRKNVRKLKSGTIETILCKKDGTEFPVEITINDMEHEGKVFYLSFAKDITKRKVAEQALKESEEFFRITLYSIADGVITTDINGNLRQMNHVAEKLTGWNEAEARGKKVEEIFNIFNEDTRQQVEIPVRRVLREGRVMGQANHKLLISKDNREIPIADSGSPIVNEKGEIIGVVLVFRDQSEERKAQRSLRESEARFRQLVENAPEAIFVQANGCFAYVNPAALRLFGVDSASQLIGKPVMERFHPDFRDIVRERIHLINDMHEEVPNIEKIYLRLDGTPFNVEISRVPIIYDGLNGSLVFFRDVTERKRVERALIRAKMVSDEANRSKTEFLANTSHELKTPLNSIIGFSELMLAGELGKISKQQKKYIGTILESGCMLLNIVNKILDISSIDYGRMDLSYTKFNLCDAIQDTCAMMQAAANRKSIKHVVDIDPQINGINADAIKFKEIVYNLVDNSIKFTPYGGIVIITATQNESHVKISVTDNGIGIAKENIERIFDPFYQVDSSTTRRYGGTGLGLALIKQFIKMHGGNIWVESEPGKGSTFTFTIPLDYGEQPIRMLQVSEDQDLDFCS